MTAVSAWSGAAYDSVAVPQSRWGAEVLVRLDLRPGARVLDAGCGSGRVTEQLLLRHPDVSVVALDSTESMLAHARSRLAPFGDRVQFVRADLEGNVDAALDGTLVDAVFSTGTFHWIRDHGRLFHELAKVLSPDGALVAQSGGSGSLASVRRILDDLDVEWRPLNNYAEPGDTEQHLRMAGFSDVWAWLSPEPVEFPDRPALVEYLSAGALSPYLADRSPEHQRQVCDAVADRLDQPVLDFVRLNILARYRP